MRFHIVFSKRINFKTLLKFLVIGLGVFGLNSCVVHADSFSTLQNYSWCPITSDYYDNSSCNFRGGASDLGTSTINGITNVLKPYTSIIQNIHKTGAESHAEYFKWGGTSGCNTGSTITFDIDIVMNDVQNIFQNSVLDYNSWFGGSGTRSNNLRGMNYFGYYTWLGYNHNDIYNNVGVQVAKNDYQKNYYNCTFVSYGSNKSLKFRCSIDSGSTGYFVRIAESNGGGDPISIRDYATDTSLPAIVTGIKVNVLNDPCKQYATDQTGVVNAITDQTNDIMEGLNDIIDNNNSNTDSLNAHIDGVKRYAQDTAEGIDNLNDSLNNSDTSFSNDWFNNFSSYNYPQDLKSIFLFPLELLETVDDNYNTCVPFALDFSSFTRRFGGFDYTLTMPCLGGKIKSLVGNDLYNTIDSLTAFALFIAFCYHCYLKVSDLMSGRNALAEDLRDISKVNVGNEEF